MAVFTTHSIHAFRLSPEKDLLESLTHYCVEHNISQGAIQGIGAVKNPVIGGYNFEDRTYLQLQLEGDWELLTLSANISLKENQPFIHAHVVLGDHKGNVRGGHLFAAQIHVAEIQLHIFSGKKLERQEDPQTGLSLWPPRT